jgi:hypothetical protein
MLVKPSLYLLTTAMQHQIKKLEKAETSLKEGKI